MTGRPKAIQPLTWALTVWWHHATRMCDLAVRMPRGGAGGGEGGLSGQSGHGARVPPASGNERHPPAYSGLPIRTNPKKSARHDCHQTWHWGRLVPVSSKVFNRDYHPSEGCEHGSVPDPAASDWANQYELTVGLSREQTHNQHFLGWLPLAKKHRECFFSLRWTGGIPGGRVAAWVPVRCEHSAVVRRRRGRRQRRRNRRRTTKADDEHDRQRKLLH